jgi:tRNA pseudouridine38-40 synthase
MDGWSAWNVVSGMAPQMEVVQPVLSDKGETAEAANPFLIFDFEADGFLYNMVRAIVGTMIHVGRGRWNADDIQRILETGTRCDAGETAPPQGLYLMRVDY